MWIDFHTHNKELKKDVLQIRSFSLHEIEKTNHVVNPYSVGVHPWYIQESKDIDSLKHYATQKNCLMLGEAGLDKLVNIPLETQKEWLVHQIKLSEEIQKPLVLHVVKSYQEIMLLKREVKATQPWIIHGFNKNQQLAEDLIKQGFYLSLGIDLYQKNKTRFTELVQNLPLGRLFFESDDNKGNIEVLYHQAAHIKQTETLEIQNKIKQNLTDILSYETS